MKKDIRIIFLLSAIVTSLFLIGCISQQPAGLPPPAGSDTALAGQGFATGTYDHEYQLYNRFSADGSVFIYLVADGGIPGQWDPLGRLRVGEEVTRGTFTLTVLPRGQEKTPGNRLRLDSDCAGYNIEFDNAGNYWITTLSGVVDQFSVPLNTARLPRQISGTNDAIRIYRSSSSVAWFTLHCDAITGSQPSELLQSQPAPATVIGCRDTDSANLLVGGKVIQTLSGGQSQIAAVDSCVSKTTVRETMCSRDSSASGETANNFNVFSGMRDCNQAGQMGSITEPLGPFSRSYCVEDSPGQYGYCTSPCQEFRVGPSVEQHYFIVDLLKEGVNIETLERSLRSTDFERWQCYESSSGYSTCDTIVRRINVLRPNGNAVSMYYCYFLGDTPPQVARN
ncbi:hypothetical protein J4421_02185 [Candidatus Woesearchaeota archaeon]|nr:hypothetical protein [Candidatus Woesearchaeota archaeon]